MALLLLNQFLIPAVICLIAAWVLAWFANWNPDPSYHPFGTWQWKLALGAFMYALWIVLDWAYHVGVFK